MELAIYRCYQCHKLLLNKYFIRDRGCACGSLKIMGTSPSGFLEHLQVLWWELTVR